MYVPSSPQALLDDWLYVANLSFNETIRLWVSGTAGGVLYASFCAELIVSSEVLGSVVLHNFSGDSKHSKHHFCDGNDFCCAGGV